MKRRPLHVLLIDDDEDEYIITRDLLSEMNAEGYHLEWIAAYDEALEAIAQERYDVYLLDYRLGEHTGLDLLEDAIQMGCTAPIILLTGQGDRRIDIEAMKAGAADYLDKATINASILERSIRYAMERYRLQMNLKEREQQLSTIITHNVDGIVIVGENGLILFANPAAGTLFGYHGQTLSGRVFQYPLMPGKTNEIEIQHVDDKTVIAEMRVVQLSWKGEWVYLASLRDISEKKVLQDRLIRSERLAATGQLAASIAHEINSPLQGVTSLLSILGSTYKTDTVLTEHIELLKGAFTSIRNTVKHLLDLNRPDNAKKQTVHVNEIIERTFALFRSHLKKHNVRTKLVLSPEITSIHASSQQLSQVFMNLINNSIDAMSGKIQLDISPSPSRSRQKMIFVQTEIKGNRIIIEFSDTGPGIHQNDLQYIFDPFYTRKRTMGMGIGLSICCGIIEDHNGTITAENLPDAGARFVIILPVESPQECLNES
jgi:hypothetical protein